MTIQSTPPAHDADLSAFLTWMQANGARVKLDWERSDGDGVTWWCVWVRTQASYAECGESPLAACQAVLKAAGVAI